MQNNPNRATKFFIWYLFQEQSEKIYSITLKSVEFKEELSFYFVNKP